MALVMAEQLKRAGFKVDAQRGRLGDAAAAPRRPEAVGHLHHALGLFPEPMLSPPQLGDGAPGWWKTPAKDAALAAFNGEPDPAKRGALWGKVQQVVYDEVPYIQRRQFRRARAASRPR